MFSSKEADRRSQAKKRALDLACAFTEQNYSEERKRVTAQAGFLDLSDCQTVYGAMALLQSGDSGRIVYANRMLQQIDPTSDRAAITAAILTLTRLKEFLEPKTIENLRNLVKAFLNQPAEDIIAGRNINLPLQTWVIRIVGGLWFDRADLVSKGYEALEELFELVRDHGTIPEFNSPTYHAITLTMLRILASLEEPRISPIAAHLETHLWKELALRFHPTTGILGGPWSRTYHDSLVGGMFLLNVLLDMAWGAFYDPAAAKQYGHDFEVNCGGLFSCFVDECPIDARLAYEKEFPLTIVSRSEQVDYRVGSVWIPGGVAEVTTWMDEQMCVGTATRPHLHGMQNSSYYAHWTRNGRKVESLDQLGVAFTRFIQNRRRPGSKNYRYRNHLNGYTLEINSCYWADDGRPFVLQSGPTAVIVYVPKAQERLYVQSLEMMMVFPRVSTIDAVWVGKKELDKFDYVGNWTQPVVVLSGKVGVGLRFCPVDLNLVQPELCVERVEDHLLVGLRLVEYDAEKELTESDYRRYGGSIGVELRWIGNNRDWEQLLGDMQNSVLTDRWWMGDYPYAFGGPRKVCFQVGEKVLKGRFAPIGETWLSRELPSPPGKYCEIRLD